MAIRDDEYYEGLEKAADQTRLKFGIGDQTNLDMMTLIVKMKHLGMIKNYRRVPDEEMPYDEAGFDALDGILNIPERTFAAMNRNESRALMTIAEEIGHIALGHNGLRHRTTDKENCGRPNAEKLDPQIRMDEIDARRFAAAFLTPRHLAADPRRLSVLDLARRFNLGFQAATIRKQELERMYRRERGIKRPLPKGVEDFLRDAKKRGHTVTSIDEDDEV